MHNTAYGLWLLNVYQQDCRTTAGSGFLGTASAKLRKGGKVLLYRHKSYPKRFALFEMNRFALKILSLFIVLGQQALSQDFHLMWSIAPSFSPKLQIEVKSDSGNSEMTMRFEDDEEIRVDVLDQSKINKLYTFLSNYSFPRRTNVKVLDSNARYYEITVLKPESGIVIIGRDTLLEDFSGLIFKGDTLKLSPGDFMGDLKYDSIKEQYYWNVRIITFSTDGTTYKGKYTVNKKSHDFEIYYTRFTDYDLELISLLLSLIDDSNSPYYQYIDSNLKEIKTESN